MRSLWGSLLWCVLAPCLAWARPEVPVLVTRPTPWPEGLEKELKGAHNRLSQLDLVLIPVPAKLPPIPDANAPFKEAEAALARLDLSAAATAHEKALSALSQSAALEVSFADLFLSRAWLALSRGDTKTSKQELLAAAVVDPGATPNPVRYPPKLISAYREALTAVAAGSYGKVLVTAPEKAQIFIDGRPSSTTISLPYGAHFLRVESEGFAPFVMRFELSSAELPLEVSLQEDLYAQDQKLRESAAQNPALAVFWAKRTGYQRILLLHFSGGSFFLELFNTATGELEGNTTSALARLSDDIVALLDRPSALTLPLVVLPTPIMEKPFWKTGTFLLPAGLAVIGGGALLVFDLANQRSGVRPSIDTPNGARSP